MGPDPDSSGQSFALKGRPSGITLDRDGIHHPRSPRGGGFAYSPYESITHLATSARALWIGTRRSVYVISRRTFVDAHGPENLVRSLLARIAQRPGGSAQLARMAEIEETARTPGSLRATWGLAIACLVVFILQLAYGPYINAVGHYNPVLVADGDLWRLVTANLIHAFPRFPLHLVLNVIGLLALGGLAERSLGTARTVCVMGVSGIASMAASGLSSSADVVGVSGVVFGLVGAVVWLEFRAADQLPAWWRIPRRALVVLLLINAVLTAVVPMIAGAAHVGGFVAGLLVTALVAGHPAGRRPSPSWVRAAGVAVGVVVAAGVGAAAFELMRPGDYAARHTERLASLPGISPEELNNHAWLVAVDPDASREQLEAALRVAERAVEETNREEPTILDTLAEIQFLLGRDTLAVQTIDEAIERDPDSPYYREQRRRFLGERPADDRPIPFYVVPPLQNPPTEEEADPGVTV